MIVKPIELANLCALYCSLRSEKLEENDLINYIKNIMLIDSNSNSYDIINYTKLFNLIYKKGTEYLLTVNGRKLGKLQNRPDIILKEKSKKFLIKECFLNINLFDLNCKKLILCFEPNSFFETFVYKRTYSESIDFLNWMKTLDSVDLLYSDKNIVYINKEYLNLVNVFLTNIRNESNIIDNTKVDNRTVIGDIAEEIAFKFEIKRLKSNGYEELSKLVQKISKIDTSAGYDIISFQGSGIFPETNRFIEVKGTQSEKVQFIWSRNERRVAELHKKKYWIYCYTNVNINKKEAKGPKKINNPINQLSKLKFYSEPIDIFYSKSNH